MVRRLFNQCKENMHIDAQNVLMHTMMTSREGVHFAQ